MKCPTGSEEMFYLALSAFHISHFKSISYWFQLVYCKIGLIAVVYSFYPHSSWFFNHLINNTPHQFSLDNFFFFQFFPFRLSLYFKIILLLFVCPSKMWRPQLRKYQVVGSIPQSWVAESEYSWLVSWRASRTLPFAYVFLSEYW